jgi:hypothetical protein
VIRCQRVGSLPLGTLFFTVLTRRQGRVIGTWKHGAEVVVWFDDDAEQSTLHPDVVVEVGW